MATTTTDDNSIGERLRRIRRSRGKSQGVIAGLAGISTSYLSRLESGHRALDRQSLILRLADALQVAPSELTRVPAPAPGNGHTDSAIEGVRRALIAVGRGRPGGLVLPVDVLRDRVARIQETRRRCRVADVASDLPGLIRDLHTTLLAGRDVAELLPLVSLLHVQVTNMWLKDAGAPVDLLWQADALARDAAAKHGERTTLGLAAFGTVCALKAAGMFELAQAELDAVEMPAVTSENVGLVSVLTMENALVAVMDKRPGDVAAPLEAAIELTTRVGETGEGDPLGFGFGPTSLAARRVALALEADEPDRAVSIAEGVHPERLPYATRKAGYWVDFGRAAARLRGRRDDAARALLTAEDLHAVRVYRDPFAREAIAGLVVRSRDDSIGRDLRKMAHRAGLPV